MRRLTVRVPSGVALGDEAALVTEEPARRLIPQREALRDLLLSDSVLTSTLAFLEINPYSLPNEGLPSRLQERKLVYTALFIACAVIALGAGLVPGLWSFVQVAVMIELAYWIRESSGGYVRRRR